MSGITKPDRSSSSITPLTYNYYFDRDDSCFSDVRFAFCCGPAQFGGSGYPLIASFPFHSNVVDGDVPGELANADCFVELPGSCARVKL